MNLHNDIKAFHNAVLAAGQSLNILPTFIVKDYWITLVLKRLSESKYVDSVVFKGGTSLSKAYKLINRFSEDVDIAVVNASEMTGNQLKALIRSVEKEIAQDLEETKVEGVTSKGSRFRKSVYEYKETDMSKTGKAISNSIIVEINSFANPFPYSKENIQSLIGEYLNKENQADLINKYGLEEFKVNVLDRKRTLVEKLVSLIRFSFSEDPATGLSEKIRHFYDLYYLEDDSECNSYINSDMFVSDLKEIISHDRITFDEPKGWTKKKISDSPLISNFDNLWNKLKGVYTKELSMLAFTEIPEEKDVAEKFKKLVLILSKLLNKF